MDPLSSSSPSASSFDASSLSPSDRQEVERFAQAQNTQMAINKIVQDLTDTCWKKCLGSQSGRLSGAKLSSTEESCANNCAARWLDSQTAVLKALGAAAGNGGDVGATGGIGDSFGSGDGSGNGNQSGGKEKKGWFS